MTCIDMNTRYMDNILEMRLSFLVRRQRFAAFVAPHVEIYIFAQIDEVTFSR